ncbi:MAG: hypothetical protein ACM3Q1_10460 [Bacteroidales bacterium]
MSVANLADYEIRLRQKNGLFYAAVTELNLWAQGATPDEAVRLLQQRHQANVEDLREAVSLGILPQPSAPRRRAAKPAAPAAGTGRSALAELGLFVAKLAIVLACLGLAGAIVGKRAASMLEKKLSVARMLDSVEQNATPERVAAAAGHVRALVGKVQPVLAELDPVLQCPQPRDASPARKP